MVKWFVIGDHVSVSDLRRIEEQLPIETLREINKRTQNIVYDSWGFKDVKDLALAKEFFRLGFITGCTQFEEYKPEQNQ